MADSRAGDGRAGDERALDGRAGDPDEYITILISCSHVNKTS